MRTMQPCFSHRHPCPKHQLRPTEQLRTLHTQVGESQSLLACNMLTVAIPLHAGSSLLSRLQISMHSLPSTMVAKGKVYDSGKKLKKIKR